MGEENIIKRHTTPEGKFNLATALSQLEARYYTMVGKVANMEEEIRNLKDAMGYMVTRWEELGIEKKAIIVPNNDIIITK